MSDVYGSKPLFTLAFVTANWWGGAVVVVTSAFTSGKCLDIFLNNSF